MSASEKLGCELLAPDEADGDDDDDEDEDGKLDEDEDGELDDEDGLVVDEEDCATAAVDSAKSTAAVMMLRFLGMGKTSDSWEDCACIRCKRRALAATPVTTEVTKKPRARRGSGIACRALRTPASPSGCSARFARP